MAHVVFAAIQEVDVPVRLINDDKAPGVKQGGWMQMFRRTVRFQAQGQFIPPYVDVDVGELGLEQILLVLKNWRGNALSPPALASAPSAHGHAS
eukprot:scaffold95694_cov19-Tisochrysis_lutea.AAC.3